MADFGQALAHAAHNLAAKGRKALPAAAHGGISQQVLIVPYKRGGAHAQPRKALHVGGVAAEGLAAFDG